MGSLLHDLRYGARMLLNNPGFSFVAVLTLSLGIGANTAIFSVINAVLLRPLPYHEPDRLAMLWTDDPKHDVHEEGSSYLNFADWRSESQTFADMAICSRGNSVTLIGTDEPERVRAENVSANLFPLLGVKPMLGRTFSPDEQKGGERVVVLSYGLWQRRFGGATDVIGKTLETSDQSLVEPARVIGVMPPGFYFPSKETQLWLPSYLEKWEEKDRFSDSWRVVGRLKPQATFREAQAEMTAIGERLTRAYPIPPGSEFSSFGVNVVPLLDQVISQNLRLALWVLLGAVVFVLLIACANVANLMLARGASREREFAIRAAMGAGRVRLLRQLLTESLLLAVGAGLFGLGLAVAGVRVLVWATPAGIPRLDEIGIDNGVLLFTAGLSLLASVLFGLVPAWKMSRSNPNEALKEGGSSASGGLRLGQMRGLLVVVECTLAVVLLIAAGLLLRSFQRLRSVDPGFKSEGVLLVRVSLKQESQAVQVLERLRGLPDVQAVGAIEDFLIRRNPQVSIVVEGHPPNPDGQKSGQLINAFVSPGFLQAMSVPLLRGRFFSDQDLGHWKKDRGAEFFLQAGGDAAGVIINETMARQFFPDQDPTGQRIRFSGSPADEPRSWMTVVGVVGDMHRQGLEKRVIPQIYLPSIPCDWGSMDVVMRTSSDPLSLAGAVRHEIRAVDKAMPILNISTLDSRLGELGAQRRFQTWLLAIFAGVALVLSAIGIFGVMHYAVAQRTHEIGIRIALGAQTSDVLRLVIGQGMKLVVIGVVAGVLASLWLTDVMAHLLFEVSATDPATFGGVAVISVGVALLACYLPAQKAAKVDPMVALHYE